MSETGVDTVLSRAVAERERLASPSARRVSVLTRTAGVAGMLVAAIGVLGGASWILDLHALIQVGPGAVTMKFSTAVCLAALGAAIAISADRPSGSRSSLQVVLVLVAPAFGLSVLTLTEDALGVTLPADNLFGFDPGDAGTPVPGRMAQATAVALVVLATAVVLSARRRPRPAQVSALVALTIGMTALLGYVYGVEGLYDFGPFNTMAVPTALAIAIGSGGVLFLRPDEGYVEVFVGNTAGGVIVRRVLPWAVVAPYVVGAAIVFGLHRDWYSGSVALATFVIVVANAGTALVWFQGAHLRDVDLRRGGAEDALRIAEEALAQRDRIEAELAANVRRTHRILATAADAYIAIDAHGRVTDWNEAAVTVFGWSREEALGECLEDLVIPAGHAAAHRAGLVRHAGSGQAPMLGQLVELEAVTRSGARIPVELTVWAEQEGAVSGFHAFVRDITTRKRAEQSLRQLNADLTEFAAIAAHDLRSPLTTIQMQVDLVLAELEEGWGPEETRDWVEKIGRTAERGVTLIDDLLAYVSIGREAHTPEPVDLDALVRDVAEAELAAAGRPATWRAEPLPTVAGDPGLLRQLVTNLVGNALKYVPADRTPSVVVDALVSPGEDDFVLRVSDNGDGFEADERDRVFDMFQRGRGSSSAPGTGIGLAICRRVAERHGGRIWIDPAPTSGSRICVRLPLWRDRA